MTDTTIAGASSEAPEAPATGTPAAAPDEATTLRSRNAGLDAKVTELTLAKAAAEAAAQASATKLADYEAGKVNADEALRAQLAAAQGETATARKEAALALVEAKYPETFAVLGEASASLTADQLAASEARFRGVPAEPTETTIKPTPLSTGTARPPTTAKNIEDMSAAELRKHMELTFTGRDQHGNPV